MMEQEMVPVSIFRQVREERDALKEELAEIKRCEQTDPAETFTRWGWLRFTRTQQALFNELMWREMAMHQTLHMRSSEFGEIETEQNIVKVYISQMRKKLETHGVGIHVRRGIGYFITAADKKRLNGLADQQALARAG